MGLFTPSQRAKYRRFAYEPRYYDPKKDEDLKRRMRIQSHVRRRKRSPMAIVFFVVMLLFALYLYSGLF